MTQLVLFDGKRLVSILDSVDVEGEYGAEVYGVAGFETAVSAVYSTLSLCRGLNVGWASGSVSLDELRRGAARGLDVEGELEVLYARPSGGGPIVVMMRFLRGLAARFLDPDRVGEIIGGGAEPCTLSPMEKKILLAYRLAGQRAGGNVAATLLYVGLSYVARLPDGELRNRTFIIEESVLDAQLRWALGGYNDPLDDAAVDRLLGERLGLDCPGGRGRRPAPVTYGDVVAGIAETLNEKPFPEPPVDVESLKEVIMRAFEEGVKNWERMAGERRGQREEEKDGYEGEKE